MAGIVSLTLQHQSDRTRGSDRDAIRNGWFARQDRVFGASGRGACGPPGADDVMPDHFPREHGEGQHSAAHAHQHEKAEHLEVIQEQRHGGRQLHVTTANCAPPEQQNCGAEYCRRRRQTIPRGQRVAGERNAEQAEQGNSET